MDHDSSTPRDERDARREQAAQEQASDASRQEQAPDATRASRRTPVVPDNGFSRESYAIHAARSDLPLFSDALNAGRDDSGWLSSLSSTLAGPTGPVGSPDSAAETAQAALDRRTRRRSDESDS
ncbi:MULTISPECIES: hypothetical protein [unclassified Rathayibacter]|uniref:hypothetical protein n=1 Tax=unclassified Rathayibacter TaxID=2609250 RepID=UPI000CE853B4|nr:MULTISPECIES: hypothetical protein [unclassified Rathayibacter]PPH56616.1 hypothetical protein C5C67_00760 [Rathayibacter sp. AY1E1]PPH90626.1 hypothetical protein C5C82_05935 [Rathayibacter sp. AY1D5]